MSFERDKPPAPWIVRIVVAIVIAIYVGALLSDLAFGAIVDERPGLLIALNPHNRNLVFATIELNATSYYLIGFFRMSISGPLYFLLGYWYGERVLSWAERKNQVYGSWLRGEQGLILKFAYPLVFLFPNNLLCSMTALARAKLRTFLLVYLTGALFRLYIIRRLGERFESPLKWLVDQIAEYQWPVIGISVLFVGWTVYREFRSNNKGGIKDIAELATRNDENQSTSTDVEDS